MRQIDARLAALEAKVARLPRPATVPPAVRLWLSTLSTAELELIEQMCELMLGLRPLDVRPAEMLSDEQAVEQWRRLARTRGYPG